MNTHQELSQMIGGKGLKATGDLHVPVGET